MVDDSDLSTLSAFPLPPSTPASSTYPCQQGSQHAKNNFRPRQFKRIPSSTESKASLRRSLQKYWGHSDFRGPQLDICQHVLKGCDVLVVAPTGLGKSVCFQVPAVTMEYGITIVVSPLLALMRDQVTSLRAKGIQAYQLSEKTDIAEIREIKRQLRMGHPRLRLLYVTPETLFSAKYTSDFDIAYRQRQMVRLVVDEAHVIDEWGSTFRPTYRRLGEFRIKYPGVPITALTASATSDVRDDMTTILNMPKTPEHGLAQWVEPFNRKNLFYEVRYQGGYDRQSDTLQDIVRFVKRFITEASAINERNGVNMPCVSGLVYCRYKADCDNIASVLTSNGVSARAFYASLPEYQRNETLDDWKAGRVECIVATIAFGMGVDQAHVRYVIHYDMPKSFEGYYQETGRAGRDGHRSRCVLYYSREDAIRLRGLISKEVDRAKDNNDKATLERGKLRMINSFKALQLYAESVSTCRHIDICRYFGEQIDTVTAEIKEKYCDGMCDVCSNRAGVFHRSSNLSEEVDVSSPIIKPKPLEPPPEYFTLSTQAGCSLAAWHRPTALQTSLRATNLPTTMASGSMAKTTPSAFFQTPPPPRTLMASRQMLSLRDSATPSRLATPGRVQTIDQIADNGLMGAVAVLEPRSPGHAERKRKAREDAFKDVEPAASGGPFSFYNNSAPKRKGRVGVGFKIPSMQQPAADEPEAAASSSPTRPGAEEMGRNMPGSLRPNDQVSDRKASLLQLQDALKITFAEGPLADKVLHHWGRQEAGEQRAQLLRKVARELELDMAKMARTGSPYDTYIADTCASLKLVRSLRGVDLVVSGSLASTQDPRVLRLRHVETCFRKVK